MRFIRVVTAIAAMSLLVVAGPLPASGQEHEHEHEATEGEPSEIASLTLQEIEGLKAGDGMGVAEPAELNHYPGPKHVLELAGELGLTESQRVDVESIRASMLDRAIPLGEKIIEAERMLNRRFEHQHMDDEGLREATSEIAVLYGELRYVHLAAHLQTKALLTVEQVADYDRLRGYTGDG
jgi:hypothetical protein